jgi:hypothetical protein
MEHLPWKTIVAGVWFAAAGGSMLLRAQQRTYTVGGWTHHQVADNKKPFSPVMTMVGGKIVYDGAETR